MVHELCGAGTALQHDLPAPLAPELMPHLAVARVAVAVDVIQCDVGHLNSTSGLVMCCVVHVDVAATDRLAGDDLIVPSGRTS